MVVREPACEQGRRSYLLTRPLYSLKYILDFRVYVLYFSNGFHSSCSTHTRTIRACGNPQAYGRW